MTQINALTVELELARKLFWLASHDLIFFSTYDEVKKDWVENGAFPCVNCNDIHVPGADAEQLQLEELDTYIEVCKKYIQDHPEYIWCIAKRSERPWRNPESLNEKQREGVAFTCQLLGTSNPFES